MKLFYRENPIRIYTKTHQIAPFNKNFSGGMLPSPPSKAHGFAMRSMSLRDMQISKSEKNKFLAPPCQILATLVLIVYFSLLVHIKIRNIDLHQLTCKYKPCLK